MRTRRFAALLVCVALVVLTAGCGSDDDTDVAVNPLTTLTDPNSVPSNPSTSVPATTPFTFPPKNTAPFTPGQGSFTITGDQQATGQFSSASCPSISVTAPRGIVASLVFVSNANLASARRWLLELVGMSPGQTTFPEPAGFNQIPPRRVRLSVDVIGQTLTWGTTAAGEGTVTGTITAKVPDAKSGTFDLQLGFSGSAGTTGPRTPVQIKGDWSCPES